MGAEERGTKAMQTGLDFGNIMSHISSWFREKEVGFTFQGQLVLFWQNPYFS
jgi:hypothetical protein